MLLPAREPLAPAEEGWPSLRAPTETLSEVAALWRRARREGEVAEIYLQAARTLSMDLDPASHLLLESMGTGSHATVRLWTPQGSARAEGWWSTEAELLGLISTARASVSPRGTPPVPERLQPIGAKTRPEAALSSEHVRTLAWQWARQLEPLGTCIQALLVQQTLGWCGLVHSSGATAHDWLVREQALVRCETPNGALVDGVAAPWLGRLDPSAATERLRLACETLQGTGARLDTSLPLVLRPAVAAPLVSGLAWALRGEVAASVPGLARAVGKKIFPSVLTVLDDPRHPSGTFHRRMDDEGEETSPVLLIQEGQLLGFLHSRATAASLGVARNGRGLRIQKGEAMPGALNLHVSPGPGGIPDDRTELVARVETFTTMRQPGVVSLMAWGWEYRGGERRHRVGPLELELPILATFRQLQGVGSDLAFFPASEGCGTPTLVLSPPVWLADSRSK